MARNDIYLNINSLSPADAVVTGQQDMTAATIPELVLGDTPTFNFYFTDNTNVWPSWAGNASYTLTWALSDAVAGDFTPAATTANATPITGGWSVVLPLNSYDLVGLLNTKRVGQPYPVQNLWQQLRVTDPSGNEITRAMFWTPVRYRAISDTQNTESASPTGGRFVTVNNVNTLTTPTAAQFYAANPVPTSALGTAANGELLIGNGTGFTKATLTAGSGVSITNGSGSITITATDGDITLDDGTAAAPSLKFTADTDTGLFRPSDNVVGISAGGVSRATFGATSAINGTTIPASKTLVVTTDKLSALAATTSAELAGVISDETGTGALVFATSPTLTTPILGTPQSGTLSSCTGLPISTGVSGLGTNVATFLATPSSANLASAVTDETGTGALVFANTPTLVTPNIGAATGTSVNLSGAGTFGGNLTVSGAAGLLMQGAAIGATAAGEVGINYNNSATGSLVFYGGTVTPKFTVTNAGNLTASGTGTHTFGTTNTVTMAAGVLVTLSSANYTSFGTGFASKIETFAHNYNLLTGLASSGAVIQSRNGLSAGVLQLNPDGGNLLVGTTTDGGQKLQVVGQSSTGFISATDYSNGDAGQFIARGARGTAASPLAQNASDSTGLVRMYGYDGSSFIENARIYAQTVGTIATNRVGGVLSFWTHPDSTSAIAEAMRITQSQNLLIGTPVDSANGKLQLATHTTSAGGIGFGTDTSLYRVAAGLAALNGSGSSQTLGIYVGGVQKGTLGCDSTSTYLGSQVAGGSLFLLSGAGTTALTLDSSQNATFAGTVNLKNYVQSTITGGDTIALCGNDSTNTYYLGINYLNNRGTETIPVGTGRASWRIAFDDTDSTGNMVIGKRSGGAAANSWTGLMTLTQGGNATFTGSIAIGNTVNTVSPTSPNRTVTIVIGGTTYYLAAKTTND